MEYWLSRLRAGFRNVNVIPWNPHTVRDARIEHRAPRLEAQEPTGLLGVRAGRIMLLLSNQADDESHNREDDGDPEQELGALHGGARQTTKSQDCGHERHDEEDDGPVQEVRQVHFQFLLRMNDAELVANTASIARCQLSQSIIMHSLL